MKWVWNCKKYSFHVLLISSYLAILCFAEDYYEALQISKDATTKEIRKAFKKLALKMHPDKNLVSNEYNIIMTCDLITVE